MNLLTIHRVLLAALAALALGLVSLGLGSRPASAEVLTNVRVPFATVIDNPCEPGTNMTTLTGVVHMVWYTTPEGSVIMRYNVHYTGTGADGTQYIDNINRTMEHWAWPTFAPFSDEIVTKLVSKGSSPNARIVLTVEYSVTGPLPPAAYITNVECRG
jgi:hypothetical protein